jgi:hypothetical protein
MAGMEDIIARIDALLANTPQSEIEEFEVTRCLRDCRDEIIAARACAEMMLQGTGQRLAEGMAERVINGQTIGAWIPASERLPEDDQQCLTVDKDGVQRVARFDAIGDGERHSWYEEQEWKSVYPVAWMPLPEPPEAK